MNHAERLLKYMKLFSISCWTLASPQCLQYGIKLKTLTCPASPSRWSPCPRLQAPPKPLFVVLTVYWMFSLSSVTPRELLWCCCFCWKSPSPRFCLATSAYPTGLTVNSASPDNLSFPQSLAQCIAYTRLSVSVYEMNE